MEYLEAFKTLLFDFFGPDKPLADISRQDARNFLHMLEHMPPNASKQPQFRNMKPTEASRANEQAGGQTIAPATLNKHFSNFRAFLQFCNNEKAISSNVALGLKPKPANPPKLRKREPFSLPDLRLIFGNGYQEAARPKPNSKSFNPRLFPESARYWVPLIALFSGMRLQEICQLEVAAIGYSEDIAFISTEWDIVEAVDDHETGRIKHLINDNSERRIPMHPELIRLGLLKLHNKRLREKTTYLFPELKPRKDGKVSRYLGDWFGRYTNTLGINARSKVFHSFRYCFRGAMSVANVNPDIIRQVGGWAAKYTADRYAAHAALKRAQNEIMRVEYEGLDLSHLYR